MLVGLGNTGPTLNVPVPDSKDRNSETQGKRFGDMLTSKVEKAPTRELSPKEASTSRESSGRDGITKSDPQQPTRPLSDRMKTRSSDSTEKGEKAESQDDSEQIPQSPPDPKVKDPRTSALREQRDRAIRKFMDSFEGEFGIPPQEMVEAMSQLTTQDLEKPPEKTAGDIIAKLNLDPQDELKAKKMYLGLLMQLKQIDVRAALPKSQDDMLSQLSAQRAVLSSEKKSVMAGQIQNLNSKFWMKDQDQQANGSVNGAQKEAAEMTPLQAQDFLKKMVTADSAELEEQIPQDAKVTSSTDAVLKRLQENSDSVEDAEIGDDSSVQEDKALFSQKIASQHVNGKQELNSGGQNQDQDSSQDSGPQKFTFAEVNGGALLKKAHEAEFKKLTGKQAEGDSPKKIEKADVEALLKGDLASIPQGKLEAMKSAFKAMAIQPGVQMTPSQKAENIQQIMNQAQVLLKKGGGEVKVEMTPEGMGSIQLKLQVLDGKVQVHMNTETKEAKKLIESSMHDLKQSLAAHHLSMDLVKIDVVNSTTQASDAKNDLQNQMQNYFNQQQKEGTRQFWQSFNDSFGNRQARENIFDAENIRGPVANQKLPGISATSSNGRAYGEGRGKSLNLVA